MLAAGAVLGLGRRRVGWAVVRAGAGVAIGLAGGDGFPLSSNILVQAVKTLSRAAVEVEPPVTDEVLLVEDGAIGAEEPAIEKNALFAEHKYLLNETC